MARTRAVFAEGKWNGKTLREWVPDAVSDIVRACSPVRVILFGSVARNEEGPDSDLDFLVILECVDPQRRAHLMSAIRAAIDVPAAIDIFVTDLDETERRKDVIGSIHYWPIREGVVVYERPA